MYTLSPQERIALAQARIKNVPSYVPTIPRTTNTDIRSNYTPSVGARLLDTGVDIFGNVLTGIAKTFEGVYDWGVGLIGGAAGLFGNEEIQQRIKNHIAYDFIGNTLGKAVERGSQYSYVNELGEKGQNIVRGVASGVGQILPAVAITAATGGLGAPAALAQGLGTATFMAGAAGRGTEEAFQEGAGYGKGLAYGGLTGLMEGAIEKLSGGLAKNVFGKGLIDGVVKKVAGKATTNAVLQKGFKLLLDAGGEGAEEAIAEILNPVLKRLTYDKDAPMATKEQILESALIGGLTSLAYQGSIGRIGAKSQNVTEGVKELQTLDKKENNLWARDKLTADEQTKLAEQRQSTLAEISRNLQRMNDEKRAKTIEQYRLGDKFNSDGSLIADKLTTEENQNNENTAKIQSENYNKQAYSPSLYGKENTLAFKPTSQELTAEQKEAKVTFTSLNKGKRKVNLVFADMGKDESGNVINGAYKDGTLYVSTQAANPAEVVVKHELTHFAEGTKEYSKFASYVLRTISQSENLSKQFGNVAEKITETGELYKKVNEGKSLSEAERTILTEVVAQYTSENLFTSQEQIARIAKTERNFAQKILDWIKDKISVLKGKTKQERETIAFLRKAERLYSQALDEAWGAEDFAKGIKGETVAEDTKLSTTEQPLAKDETTPKSVAEDTKYSLTDSKGRKLTEAQAEFFKDNKVRDEQGRLLVVYHGTGAEFTVFNRKKARSYSAVSYDLPAFYFTSDKRQAKDYGSRVVEAYINIKNPLIAEDQLPTIRAGETPNDLYNRLVKEGYDGIIILGESLKDNEYIVFHPNQIKLTTNLNPTESEDIRYSLSPSLKTKMKKYTKAESEAVINDIITTKLDFGDKYGELKGKSKQQVIDQLWKGLNNTPEGKRMAVALDIADFIIENSVADTVYSDSDSEYDMYIIDTLKPYLRSIDLDGIKEDIKYKYGSDTNVFAMWGKRKGEKGVAPDVIAQELAEQGYVINVENPAEIFFAIDESYKKALKRLKNKSKTALAEVLNKQEQKDLRQDIAREILKAYETKGRDTAFGKVIKSYQKQIAELKELLKESKDYNKKLNSVLYVAQKIKDKKNRKYKNSTVLQDDRFKAFEKELATIKWRSDINKSSTRKKIAKFGELYNKENEALKGYIDDEVIEAIAFINQNKDSRKALTLDELTAVETILKAANHLFKNYDALIIENKQTTVTEFAKESINVCRKNKNNGGILNRILNRLGRVFKQIVEPRTVFASLDGYHENGGFQILFKELEKGETLAGITRIELLAEAEDFLKKGYKKRLAQTITFKGKDMPIANAISLYMTAQQEQGMRHLERSGFGYFDKKGEWVNVADKVTDEDIADLGKVFTAEDKEFMRIARDMFDRAGELMEETDLKRKGYTNVIKDGKYFPIKSYKGNIASSISDNKSFFDELNSVVTPSFTKDRVKGASNKLEIGNVFHVMQRHARLMGMYHGLAIPIDNFNRVYNKNIGEGGKVLTLRNYTNENIWSGAETYIKTLMSDIQGVSLRQSVGDKVIDWIRSSFAKYQLGANPKVVLSQASAYPAAFIYLDIDSMSKGAMRKPDYKTMDEYCPFAKIRYYDKAIVKAETVIDKLGTVGDTLTKPIQWMDRAIVGRLWMACQYQVEKKQKLKFGTKENMTEAGVLLEKVIRETQGNHTVLERSALMRSNNSLAKSFTMFMSDPLKHLSRLVENFGRLGAIKKRIKAGEKGLDAQLKDAESKVIKTVTAVASANLMYVMIGMFFKWLYDRERKNRKGEPISFTQDVVQEFAGSVVGMLPVVRDVYDYFSNGYEINSFLYGTLNDVVGATDDLRTTVEKIVSGDVTKTTDFMKPFRNSLFAMGQLTGIPVRNVNTFMTGIIGKISPETAYKYKTMFYNANYTSDLNKALEKGDENLAETIVNLMMKNKGLSKTETAVNSKIVNLYEKGYNVLPRTVSDYVIVDGERMELTNRQQKRFKSIYDGASDKVSKMIRSSDFGKLSENAQAKSIKYVYDYYYNIAVEDLIGIEADSKATLFGSAIDIEKLAMYISELSEFTTDKDKQGNAINGSLKAKIQAYVNKLRIPVAQKYMLMGYLGYKNANGEAQVQSYIRTLGLSKEKQKELLAYCGY